MIDESGMLDRRAQTIINLCDSFTEISPSGRGLHVFVLGRVLRALRGDQIEVYSTGRYIAVTGQRWPDTPAEVRPQQPYLDYLSHVDAGDHPARPIGTRSATQSPDVLARALLARLQAWEVPVARLKRWSDGFLAELMTCPWADEHTTGPGGAAVAIHASGAFNFICLHAHCGSRDWRDFRAAMEGR